MRRNLAPRPHKLTPCERLSALHHEESGAIMMAALAGTLILFMISMALYDAGNVARTKIQVQTAADTAAYSQAAVKARTMNANAYVNVTKRSIVGMAEVYHASYSMFFSYVSANARACTNDPNNPNQAACIIAFQNPCSGTVGGNAASGGAGCVANWDVAYQETSRDWDDVDVTGDGSGLDAAVGGFVEAYPSTSPISGVSAPVGVFRVRNLASRELQGSMGKYNKELQQLTRYQEYMQKITPWWAFMESVTRAVHNQATLATSFPPPRGLNTSSMPAWVNSAKGAMQSSGYVIADSGYKDWSWDDPVLNRKVTLATNLRTPWNGDADLSSLRAAGALGQRKGQSSDALEMCQMLRSKNPGTPNYDDPNLAEEMQLNVAYQKARSEGLAATDAFAGAYFDSDQGAGSATTPAILGGYSLCVMDMIGATSGYAGTNGGYIAASQSAGSFIPALNPYYASPYIVMVERDQTAVDMMRLSNIVFTYREGEGVRDGRERLEFMSGDYNPSQVHDTAKGAGSWTMARSEIVTQGKMSGTQGRVLASGEWHPNWTARLRPLSLPGELSALSAAGSSNFLTSAFYESFLYVGVADKEGLLRDFNRNYLYDDLKVMMRATNAMDDASSRGLTK